MATPIALFGPGILIATRTDITPGTPINIGDVQEFSIESAGTTKQLYGQYQLPLVAARGTIKMTGKFKGALVSGIALNSLFWGGSYSTTSGVINWNIDSTFTLSTTSSGPLQIGSSLTFDADLGVRYSTTNLPLQRVSTGLEVAGKYSVTAANAGQYNFAAADEGANLKITYSNTGGTGASYLMTNALIGTTPTFQLDYYTSLNQPGSKPFVVRLYECITDKEMLAFKLEDFMIPEWDFSLFANAAGQIFNRVWPEVD
jgi:hypothetical protein